MRAIKTFNVESVARKFRGSIASLRKIRKATYLNIVCILAVVIVAATLRSMPLRWGFYLSEFDPYMQYFITEYIVKNGFTSFFSWHDTTTWYPWGRNIALTSYPGLAFTTAVLYRFLHSIGVEVSLMNLCIVFPIILGTATCLMLYIFSKELWGRGVGLFSALFLAFSSSHIFRTAAGFYDDETIG
ncbi:hypothetical protein KEJ23_00640, partial [Candidatus Bathyarchaeota archaeon]|nr:hypothetical protein [Candidatus Bathyarchaeota archaeon]